MKGALACYVEAVRALQDAGVRLRGDVLVAAVCGEIEKTQYGRGAGRGVPRLRGRLALPRLARRRRRHVHPRRADRGEGRARPLRLALAADRRPRATSSTRRSARGSATRTRSCACARCSMRCMEWIPTWEDDPANAYRGAKAIVNVGAIQGGFGWRVSRTPHRTDLHPRRAGAAGQADGRRAGGGAGDGARARGALPGLGDRRRGLRDRAGCRDRRGSSARRRDRRVARARSSARGRSATSTRWFSDASALTRYGIPTVNYGTSTGLLDTTWGENLDIEGLVQMAHVYALAAARVCGVDQEETTT